jgi:hypothetical protein
MFALLAIIVVGHDAPIPHVEFHSRKPHTEVRELYGLGCAVFAPVEVAAGKGFGPLDDVLSTVYRV